MTSRTHAGSPYIQFAKLRPAAKYDLATSGLESYPLSGLPVQLEDLEINGGDAYGYAPLQERIAQLNGVRPECVVAAAGTSMANHIAMMATLEPGDEVLIEHPTYEVMVDLLNFLGTSVRRFERRMADGFRLDPEEVARQMTPQTRMIVLCNLHNPTGIYADEATMRAVGDIAQKHGALVLVDEVYLETFYEQRPRPAFRLGEHFPVTSSLTKAYGLSGLRCGWVLAARELAQRMWHINDLYGANAAHPAERLSVIAFDNLARVAARAKEILQSNRPALDEFLQSRADLEYVRPEFGTIAFCRLRSGSADKLYRLLMEKYETCVAPGRFFDVPQGFRIGIGGNPAMTREGLKRLGLALDELPRLS